MARHKDRELPEQNIAARQPLTRHNMLTGVATLAVAGGLGALALPGAARATAAGTEELVGLWHTVVSAQDNSFPAFQAFELYGAGFWIGSGQTDLQPANLSSSAWGIWRRAGHASFRVVGRFWTYDAHTNPTGYSAVDFTVTVSQDGNAYTGAGTLEFFDSKGTSLGPPTAIRDNGTRISFA
jgi:hypothetical protein